MCVWCVCAHFWFSPMCTQTETLFKKIVTQAKNTRPQTNKQTDK